jgi:DNA-binding transcriptional MerR regulator
MSDEEKLFYTIGEVAQIVDVKPYVLRYWETEFRKLNPQKSVTGQRAYRQRDLRMALTIKRLLYEEQYTIAGAVKKLEELDEKQGLDPLETSMTPGPIASPQEEPAPKEKPLEQAVSPTLEGPKNPVRTRSFPNEKVTELKNLISATYAILKKHNLA